MKNQTLIEELIHEADITKDQAIKSLIVVTDYAKEKYPVLRGNIASFMKEELNLIEEQKN